MTTRRLARVQSTFLGVEDHGILTCWLHVQYEGASGQGIGGYALDQPRRDENDKFVGRFGSAEGMQFVVGLIRACGAESWEKIPGTSLYVLTEDEGWNSRVVGVQGLGFGGASEPFIFADLFAKESVS